MTTQAADIAIQIASRVTVAPGPGQVAGPVDLTYGQNCREGPERPKTPSVTAANGGVGDECVFVVPTGGFADQPFIGGYTTTDPRDQEPSTWGGIKDWSFDVVVRGVPHNWDRAYLLAESCHLAIDKSPPSGYFEARAPQPPRYVRMDSQNRHVFIFAVSLRQCQ